MSAEGQKDVGNGAVLIMLGVALGIPLSIVGGMVMGQTGWGLILGPVIGVGIGLVLSMIGGGHSAQAQS